MTREPTEIEMRVARAMYFALGAHGEYCCGDDDTCDLDGRYNLHEVARAAIRATCSPTDAMIKAGDRALKDCVGRVIRGETTWGQLITDCWQAMIDAASPQEEL